MQPQYSLTKSFKEVIDEIYKEKYIDDKVNAIKVSDSTPKVLLDLGLNDYPILMTLNHAKNIMGKGTKGNQHNVDVSVLKEIPKLMENPLLIYEKNNTLNMLLKATDKSGNVVLAVIKPNGKGNYNNVEIDTNFLLSAYGKQEIIKYYDKVVSNSNIVYPLNPQKNQLISETLRLQLSNNSTLPGKQIITQNNNNSIDDNSKLSIKNKNIRKSTLLKNIPNLDTKIDNLTQSLLNYDDADFNKMLYEGAKEVYLNSDISKLKIEILN